MLDQHILLYFLLFELCNFNTIKTNEKSIVTNFKYFLPRMIEAASVRNDKGLLLRTQ